MITRYNGTDKIADVTLTKDDVPSVPDGPRLVVDNTTGQMPELGPGVYDFFLQGTIADGNGGGVVTHSGLNNTTTRRFNRIEAYIGRPLEFLHTNNADYSLIRGVCPSLAGNLVITVKGTISLINSTMTILFQASGSGADWEEIGKTESHMPNSTLPAGRLELWRNDQSTPVTRLIVNKISG